MSANRFQPAIEPQRTLGDSPFRLGPPETLPRLVEGDRQIAAVWNAHFAPIGAAELWANRYPIIAQGRPRRAFPIVKASGRIITQQEIDDALDD
jgi:hypothetical protein